MRPLTHREQQLLRLGGTGLAAYLLIFGGVVLGKSVLRSRTEYGRLVDQARSLKQQIRLYEDKAAAVEKLMEELKFDPARLSPTTAVAQASAAIQKAATAGGVQVGAVRESPARPASKDLGSLQIEAVGPVPAVTSLLARLETLGYPLVVETVQLTAEATRPGQIKVNLTISILDFNRWKKEETPRA